jgi:hypothetical protein
MHANLLHVITPRFNPVRYSVPERIFVDWVQHMLAAGVQLTVVECQLGDRPFVNNLPGVNHIGVRARTVLWVKENLINIGISRLPQDWKYVAWIDSDVFFRNNNWASDTVHALQQYDFVQPWATAYDLGPNDEHLAAHTSFGKIWHERKPIMQGPNAGKSCYTFAHPGYAFAATRGALEIAGGLPDTAILGAADHHLAMALIGRVNDSIPGNCTPGYKRPLQQWQDRVMPHIAGNLSYVPGTLEHRWHGSKIGRAYVGRWDILTKHAFDPYTDLKRNVWGLYELSGNKPNLRNAIDRYFRSRDEDSNRAD